MNLKPPLPDPFYMLVIDDDRNQFTVEGPMQDDAAWIKLVRGAQTSGREVRCFNPNTSTDEMLEWGRAHGYVLVACGSIVGSMFD